MSLSFDCSDLATSAVKLYGPVLTMLQKIEDSSAADGNLPARSVEEACLVLFGAIQTGFSNKKVLDGSYAASTSDGEVEIRPAQEWLSKALGKKKLLGADLQALQAVLVSIRHASGETFEAMAQNSIPFAQLVVNGSSAADVARLARDWGVEQDSASSTLRKRRHAFVTLARFLAEVSGGDLSSGRYPELLPLRNTASPVLLAHGWLPMPTHQKLFEHALDSLPDTSAAFEHVDIIHDMTCNEVFTDGSGCKPADPRLTVATWGTAIWNGTSFTPLSKGGLPGRLQTVLRAEITAAISALCFAALSIKPIRIWTDNKNVYDILTLLWTGMEVDVSRKADRDLWDRMLQQWRLSKHAVAGIFKVQAHADPNAQDCPITTWAVQGNDAADRSASDARHFLPPTFWTLWEQYAAELQQIKQMGVALHTMYTDIAHHALQPTIVDPDLLQPTGVHVTDIAEVDIEFCNLATLRADQLPRRFQIEVSQKILEWIADVTDPTIGAIWVSFHQLLIDFQSFSGHNGPCSNGQNWTSLEPDHYDHPQRVKWFAQYLTNLCKTISFPPDIQQRRPPSSVLAFWSGHVQLCLDTKRLHRIDEHLRKHAWSLPVRQVRRDLHSVVPGWVA